MKNHEKPGIDKKALETVKPIDRVKATTYGLCSVCEEYFYCSSKGAGIVKCDKFKTR